MARWSTTLDLACVATLVLLGGCRAQQGVVDQFVHLEAGRVQQQQQQLSQLRDAAQRVGLELEGVPAPEHEDAVALLEQAKARHRGAVTLVARADELTRAHHARLKGVGGGVSQDAFQRLERDTAEHHENFRAVTGQARRAVDEAGSQLLDVINLVDRTRPTPVSFEDHEH